jgi:hypothetical protein
MHPATHTASTLEWGDLGDASWQLSPTMRHNWRLLFAFFLGFCLFPTIALSQEAEPKSTGAATDFDSELIFGFAEGSDIGAKGEREVESVSVGSFGALGSYSNIDNETSFRYGVSNELRLSFGPLTDYFNIHNVPGLSDRSAMDFSGIITEARWNILNRLTSPFGMTLSLNPLWRRTDPMSGQSSRNYAAPVALLIDKEVIPSKFFSVLNLSYAPSFLRPNGKSEHDDSFIIIVGGSYAITPNLFFGAEIRHENSARNGNLDAHALFVGPNLFVRLAKDFTAKVAWAAQMPAAGAHTIDLTNYQRHQVELQLAYNF